MRSDSVSSRIKHERRGLGSCGGLAAQRDGVPGPARGPEEGTSDKVTVSQKSLQDDNWR